MYVFVQQQQQRSRTISWGIVYLYAYRIHFKWHSPNVNVYGMVWFWYMNRPPGEVVNAEQPTNQPTSVKSKQSFEWCWWQHRLYIYVEEGREKKCCCPNKQTNNKFTQACVCFSLSLRLCEFIFEIDAPAKFVCWQTSPRMIRIQHNKSSR